MGITIIQKSDLHTRKANAKVALVLAGGAVTGGAFKVGGLKALDDLLVNRKTTDFDIYVGLSAGAFLAAPLAAGISPAEMIKSLEGASEKFSMFRARDFYNPNWTEFVEKPLRFWLDLATFVPGSILDLVAASPKLVEELRSPLSDYVRSPSVKNLRRVFRLLAATVAATREFPFLLDYLPSGIFDNAAIERYLRENIERRGLTNDFKILYRARKKELFIAAMNANGHVSRQELARAHHLIWSTRRFRRKSGEAVGRLVDRAKTKLENGRIEPWTAPDDTLQLPDELFLCQCAPRGRDKPLSLYPAVIPFCLFPLG